MPVDIRALPLFASLDDAQLAQILATSHSRDLRDGQGLFQAGDPADRFFVVIHGQIKLFRLSLEGNEKIIDMIQPGNSFAEALMFLEQPAYPVSAAALGETRIMSFENRRFLDILSRSVATCFRVMGTMSQRLRGLIKEIDELTLQSATSRVAGMLARHMEREGAATFSLQAPKGVLASRLSVKPETFSRILHQLVDEGIIRVRGSQIEVLRPQRLRALSNLESQVGLEQEPARNPCPMTGARMLDPGPKP
jgi:CRP-like cAMP-binding protein